MNFRVFWLSLWALTACIASGGTYGAEPSDPLLEVRELASKGRIDDALRALDGRIVVQPADAQARFLKAVLLSDKGRNEEAIAVFHQLTVDFPELPEPYNNLAVLYSNQQRYDLALEALQNAVRNNPGYGTAHENLGDVYATLAAQSYDRAAKLGANTAASKRKLALLREMLGGARR